MLYKSLFCGTRSNKYSGRPLVVSLKKVHNFLNQRLDFRDSKPNSPYNLLWDVSLMVPVIARAALYWILSIFVWNFHYLVGHKLYHHSLNEVSQMIFILWEENDQEELSFWMRTIPFIALDIFSFIWRLKFWTLSKYIPECFCQSVQTAGALLTLSRMGNFGAAHGWRSKKALPA